ncbi:HEPN family nuclease [Vibrio alginolyticus]|uniref:HEPN family nuclease n=1 Tax=Vibrio alginolyticus TaxID=663 RepID=UPI00215C4DB1|nr:HEPN family nuclease [Vibrio alginolyticus]MCR9600732.1 HEPN family nuclease [Vibrio alginolyticus]MCR9603734.1 HEPN family nuclease [Vibrio alginolyticus]
MPLNHSSQYSELTDEHFSLIGRVVVEWSNVEFLLGCMLSRLLFTPEFPGRVFSRGMGAARLQNAIEDALELQELRYHNIVVPESTITEIRKMNKKLNSLRKTRNKFAHFCWARFNDNEIFGTGFSSATSGSKHQEKDYVSLTIKELKDFYAQLYELVENMSSIVESLPEMPEKGISQKLRGSTA